MKDYSEVTLGELQEDNIRKSEHISHLTGQVKYLTKQLALATGDVEAYIAAEQSGCRKDDVQECRHEWSRYIVHPYRKICLVCGVKE